MGLFDSFQNVTDANELQNKYLTDFEKGKVNKANDLAQGLVQSVIELGVKAGWTKQETLDKLNAAIAKQPAKLNYDNKVLGSAGEIVGELMIAAPASTMSWFGTGGKVAQIYKQGLFGGLWEYFTKPTEAGQDKLSQAKTAGLTSAGATAILGVASRPLEKLTNFDFKQNIQTVKDASASLGITPNLLGDFTGNEVTRAAEAVSKVRGGGVVSKLKSNVNELQKAGNVIEEKITGGAQYSGKAGENVAKAVQANYKEATKTGNGFYQKLDTVAKNNNITKILPEETAKAVNNAIDQYGDLFKVLERPSLESKLTSFGGKLGKQEVKQPAGLLVSETGAPLIPEIKGAAEFTFTDIRKAREGLIDALQAAKQQGKLGSTSATRLGEIIDAMDKDIENWGSSVSQNAEVSSAWKAARDYWKGNVIPLRDADLAISMIRDPNSGELKTDIAKLAGKIISSESTGQEGAKRASMMVAKVLPQDIKQDVAAYAFNTARTEATDAAGNFDPIKFSTFLQSRKQNLQPFVDENLDNLLNKFSYLSQSLTRNSTGMGLDETGTQMLRMATGQAIGGPIGSAVMATPVNRILESISRSAFDTNVGRSVMLSAKTLDDFRPLLTGSVVSDQLPQQQNQSQEMVIPPELSTNEADIAPQPNPLSSFKSFNEPATAEQDQWNIPPEFSNQPSASTQVNMNGNIDERQGIFNQELNQLLQRSNAAQASGNQGAMQQITGDIQGLLREAQRNKLQLSVQ
jgi:hypothetical protein